METTGAGVQGPCSIEVVSPFPTQKLGDAYQWHRRTTSAINGANFTHPQFELLMYNALKLKGARSWGVKRGEDLVGIVVFEPIWRVGQIVDGSVHIALARRAWGQQVLQQAAELILTDLFSSIPTLMRLSGFTPAHYSPGLAVAESIGFEREGVLRDAVSISGRLCDVVITGLTRSKYNGLLRRSNN